MTIAFNYNCCVIQSNFIKYENVICWRFLHIRNSMVAREVGAHIPVQGTNLMVCKFSKFDSSRLFFALSSSQCIP